ncbi:MAG: helix-turn-helix domain-containing protein [Pirellulaceae bacterium]|jgi:ribosome-binding protein aMBF1 (putative translation factor)|nr:helix-turn-helix domain-containing protein [Pirellulaceae bacterium]MCU0981054.1 helix-turn-helix domain-containing protein [Pirellulaceae bacterium]
MIKNEREYRITKVQAEKFRRAVAAFHAEKDTAVHPRLRCAQADALRSQLADLDGELKQYEALRSGKRRVIRTQSLADLPRALIEARVASGLSQRDLAERLGLKEQQIQRYEATEYASASLRRIREVVGALGVDLAGRITCAPPAVVAEESPGYGVAKGTRKSKYPKK